MSKALIGWSGFVGTTLLNQTEFDARYRSTDIAEIRGRSFDLVVCSAAPAQKWIANREPEADRQNIEALIAHLDGLSCSKLVLISTVDVFKDSCGVDEDTPIDTDGLHAYGRNRYALETALAARFPDHLIVRLPGLVGPGLRKNVIFDALNDNNLHAIDHRGVFQFYPMVNLWSDIQTALAAGLKVVHLTAEPVSVAEVLAEGFGRPFVNETSPTPARYDMRSRHSERFGGAGAYTYSRRETLLAIRAYAQSEPRTLAAAGATP